MTERPAGETAMSDPAEATQANPHPISQHRTPWEIALDEAGPIGNPDRDVSSQKAAGAERTRHAKGPGRAESSEKKADTPGKKRKRR
jgi:hypothetical protein